jgi:hypothetical protein
MKYFSALFQARARIANDAMYRTLAEKVVDMESDLSAIRAELSKVASSFAVVEKILGLIGWLRMMGHGWLLRLLARPISRERAPPR